MRWGELRRAFHDELADLRTRVEAMADVVVSSISVATEALLAGDSDAARGVILGDGYIDETYPMVEADVFRLVARQAPVARDLRFLIATLRIAQEIERSGDLVSSVAKRVATLDPLALTPPVRSLLAAMGEQSEGMFAMAAACYASLDSERASSVRVSDDAMDELHRRLLLELFTASCGPVGSIVELGLIARFYERIADHAVVIAERVRFVVVGEMDAGDPDESSYGDG